MGYLIWSFPFGALATGLVLISFTIMDLFLIPMVLFPDWYENETVYNAFVAFNLLT